MDNKAILMTLQDFRSELEAKAQDFELNEIMEHTAARGLNRFVAFNYISPNDLTSGASVENYLAGHDIDVSGGCDDEVLSIEFKNQDGPRPSSEPTNVMVIDVSNIDVDKIVEHFREGRRYALFLEKGEDHKATAYRLAGKEVIEKVPVIMLNRRS